MPVREVRGEMVSWRLNSKVKDNKPGEAWSDDVTNAHVLRVGQVFIAALGSIEAHDEAMCEVIVEAFIALIRAVFDGEKARDFTDHAHEFAEAFIDLFLSDFGEELEYAVVSDHGGMSEG